jgi:hypothetical protein
MPLLLALLPAVWFLGVLAVVIGSAGKHRPR